MELAQILERIERRLEAVQLSASAASKLAGKPDAIRNLQRAVEAGGRQGISTATLNALASVLETTAIWLLAGAGPEAPAGHPPSGEPNQGSDSASTPTDEPKEIRARPIAARYAGLVEAGSFRAVDEFDDEPDREPLWVLADKEFSEQPMLFFEAAGDSMNALKPRPILSGDRLVCLDFEGLRGNLALRDGLVVVVEQTLDGGHHRERSVKQVELYEDRVEFCPRSNNRRHKPIVVPRVVFTDPSEEDGRMVRVLAIVRFTLNEMAGS